MLLQEDIRGRPEDFELGKPALLEQLFLLRRDVAQHYLNAGSYGGVYRCALPCIWRLPGVRKLLSGHALSIPCQS